MLFLRMDAFIKKHTWAIAVVVAVTLMTIPRAVIDYGFDGDAARSAQAAERLFETGSYEASRLPGNPLFEYLLVLVVPWGGHTAANLFVFVFYLASVVIFIIIAKERENGLLLIGIFSLTPIVIVNAATTMDYIPGLALLMGSYAGLIKRRHVLASILLGLSIGFRLTNGLFLLPVILYLATQRCGLIQIGRFIVITIVIGGAFYLPIFTREGSQMFVFPISPFSLLSYLVITGYKGLMLLGPLATAGILLMLLVNSRRIVPSMRGCLSSQAGAASVLLELNTVALFVLLFIAHSDETAYLIPVIPFFYLLLARWLSRKQFVFIGLLVVSYAFFSVELKGGESGRRKLGFESTSGIVLRDYQARHEIQQLRKHINRFDFSDKAVILTGLGPILTYHNDNLTPADYREILPHLNKDNVWEPENIHRITGRNVFLVYALSRENVVLLQQEGYDVFIFSWAAPSVAIHKYGYDPYQLGIEKLDILNEDAFYKVTE